MRATRAYLAGLGTAGALLLGAAALFLTATAVVAFHSWPGSRGGGRPARLALSLAARSDHRTPAFSELTTGRPGSGAGPAARRPDAARRAPGTARRRSAAPQPATGGTVASSPAAHIHLGTGPRHAPTRVIHPVHHRPASSGTSPAAGSAPVASSSPVASAPSSSPTPGIGSTTTTSPISTPSPGTASTPVATVTGAVGTAVNHAGSTVSGVGTAVGGTVSHLGAGTPVAPVTSGVGRAVNGVGRAVGTTVSTLGTLLGG